MTETTAKKVLIVDDDHACREMYVAALEPRVSDIWAVRDAGDALAFLQERRDVTHLLTDTQMPGMDGLTFARLARAHYPDLRIMIHSGDRSYAHEFRTAHEQGIINAYCFKDGKLTPLRAFVGSM